MLSSIKWAKYLHGCYCRQKAIIYKCSKNTLLPPSTSASAYFGEYWQWHWKWSITRNLQNPFLSVTLLSEDPCSEMTRCERNCLISCEDTVTPVYTDQFCFGLYFWGNRLLSYVWPLSASVTRFPSLLHLLASTTSKNAYKLLGQRTKSILWVSN